MNYLFYGSALVSVLATLLTITRINVVHALLYFIVSLLSLAVIFFSLGAHFEKGDVGVGVIVSLS